MITGKELQKNLQLARIELKKSRRKRALSFGMDVNATIKARVINKGLNADGDDFGIYSTSYAKWRRKHNLSAPPFPKVNFKKTSRMWTNTRAVVSHDEAPVVYVGPITPENIEKLAWNEERFGKIIELNENEHQRQMRIEVSKIAKIFKKLNLI